MIESAECCVPGIFVQDELLYVIIIKWFLKTAMTDKGLLLQK
jgi:hypothetical protein